MAPKSLATPTKSEPNTTSENDQTKLELAKAVLFLAKRSPLSRTGGLMLSSLPMYTDIRRLGLLGSDYTELSNVAAHIRFRRWKIKNEGLWEEMVTRAEQDYDAYFADLVSPFICNSIAPANHLFNAR